MMSHMSILQSNLQRSAISAAHAFEYALDIGKPTAKLQRAMVARSLAYWGTLSKSDLRGQERALAYSREHADIFKASESARIAVLHEAISGLL